MPARPSQSALAKRASSSRSTFCASRRNAPSPTPARGLAPRARLHVVRDEAEHLRRARRSRRASARSAIEERGCHRHALASRAPATGCARQSPRWSPACRCREQTAPSIIATAGTRGRSSMRVAAWSITISVCVHTSPSGCHSGILRARRQRPSSGNSRSTTPRSSAEVEANRRTRRAAAAASRLRPRSARPAGRRAACDRHSCAVVRIDAAGRNARRTAPRAGREGCRRRTSAGPPPAARRSRRSRVRRRGRDLAGQRIPARSR